MYTNAGKVFFERILRIVGENLPLSGGSDDDSIAAEVCNIVARLCGGATAEMEASCVVKDFKANPSGVTQILLCSMSQLARAGVIREEFSLRR